MTQEHLIIPSRELVQEWLNAPRHTHAPKDGTFVVQKCHSLSHSEVMELAAQAARWGADQELEACRLWVSENCDIYSAVELIQFRRPKSPSLKEQALEALDEEHADMRIQNYKLIRSVLESLPS